MYLKNYIMESKVMEEVLKIMENEPPVLRLDGKTMVAGDTHGDIIISREVVKKFLHENFDYLVFLGDYVDRAPKDISSSFPNINFLLEMKVKFPEKIYLLKGNHEANYAIPCSPNEFEREAGGLYGKYAAIFQRMPLAIISNNIFLSHAGFPLEKELDEIEKNNIEDIEEITWSDAAISPVFRGAGKRFTEKDLNNFLNRTNTKGFVRGHDYNLNGMIVYKKCLTIFTSRLYAKKGNGGILITEIGKEADISHVVIRDFSSGEWKIYKPRYMEPLEL